MKTIIAIFLIGAGLLTRYHIGRRRFNRRGIAGIQQFSSYGKAVCTLAIEKLLLFLATLCLLAGMVLSVNEILHHFKF